MLLTRAVGKVSLYSYLAVEEGESPDYGRSSGVPFGLLPLPSMVVCISLMVKVVEHFMYLLFVLLMTVVRSFAHFIIGVFVCLFVCLWRCFGDYTVFQYWESGPRP